MFWGLTLCDILCFTARVSRGFRHWCLKGFRFSVLLCSWFAKIDLFSGLICSWFSKSEYRFFGVVFSWFSKILLGGGYFFLGFPTLTVVFFFGIGCLVFPN